MDGLFMRLGNRFFVVTLAGAGLVLVGPSLLGCNGMGNRPAMTASQGPPASPVQHPLLENIPLPVGFRMVPERSVARASGQMRVAQCEFEGGSNPDAVARFYTNYMPSAKFILKQKRFDNGEYTLRFESDAEECNIRVRPGRLNTVLVVDIGPLPRGTAEREANPAARRQ